MARRTNAFLLVLLAAAFLTGWLGFAFGTAPARWSLVIHAATGLAVVLLIPWKSAIARHGIERRRRGWWASIVFAALVLLSVVAGLAHSTGVLRTRGDWTAIAVHVGAAFGAVPFAIWHVVARPVALRRTDFGRRRLLQGGAMLAGAAGIYAATEAAARIGSLPGARRRFTGSYDAGAFDPGRLPATSWLFDQAPAADRDNWRLTIRVASGSAAWTLAELARFDDRLDATLDCTGGFYSLQAWSGVRLDRLIRDPGDALSFEVRSATGYARRFPIEDLSRGSSPPVSGGRNWMPGTGSRRDLWRQTAAASGGQVGFQYPARRRPGMVAVALPGPVGEGSRPTGFTGRRHQGRRAIPTIWGITGSGTFIAKRRSDSTRKPASRMAAPVSRAQWQPPATTATAWHRNPAGWPHRRDCGPRHARRSGARRRV